MSDTTYNDLKWTAHIGIPGLAALYFIVDVIWDLPYTTRVLGILAVITLLLGIVLSRRNLKYDGQMVVSRGQNGSSFVLELDGDPYDLPDKESVTFKVVSNSSEG